jgi:hypothetical protein
MAKKSEVASNKHANKDILGESNSSTDLRCANVGSGLLKLSERPQSLLQLFEIEPYPSASAFLAIRTRFNPFMINAIHKSYLDYLRPKAS